MFVPIPFPFFIPDKSVIATVHLSMKCFYGSDLGVLWFERIMHVVSKNGQLPNCELRHVQSVEIIIND
jgi:hypothetical protein